MAKAPYKDDDDDKVEKAIAPKDAPKAKTTAAEPNTALEPYPTGSPHFPPTENVPMNEAPPEAAAPPPPPPPVTRSK